MRDLSMSMASPECYRGWLEAIWCIPALYSLCSTQLIHYRTKDQVFDAVSSQPKVQLSKSFRAALRLALYYLSTPVNTVQLAFPAQKLTSKSVHSNLHVCERGSAHATSCNHCSVCVREYQKRFKCNQSDS